MINEAFHPLSPLDNELLHYFSVLGRALFTAQQLEMNCRAIVGFLHMRDQAIIQGPSAIEDPKFQEWMDQLWKKTLGQHIKTLCKTYSFSDEISPIFEDARKARNTIAHEIAMGVIDRLDSGGLDEQIVEIKDLVRKIAAADKIAAAVIHILNKDPLTTTDFFGSYEDKIVAWVTEDTFKE
jgi:hypothetical protein